MALEILSGRGLLFRRPETDAMITMPVFTPQRVCPPYDFDITRSQQGYWIACDRGGLTGGTFLNREDAVHFALFETGGNSAHVHIFPEPKAAQSQRRP
jgi:hypothetical protein